MIGLDRLMERKGVIAAGQFSKQGEVLRSVGDLDKADFERVAKACLEQTKAAEKTALELDQATPLDWSKLNGWVVWSGGYALCVAGETGVLVDSARADFNQLMVDLFGPPAAGMPLP